MTDRFGLKPGVIASIQSVLAGFEAIDKAILYGSRAKGNYKVGSDIDLALLTADKLQRRYCLRLILHWKIWTCLTALLWPCSSRSVI